MGAFEEMIYGKEYADKIDLFKSKLLEVEENNKDWFESRPSDKDISKHDRLHWHCVFQYDAHSRSIKFIKDTELPKHIQIECEEAFSQIFPK